MLRSEPINANHRSVIINVGFSGNDLQGSRCADCTLFVVAVAASSKNRTPLQPVLIAGFFIVPVWES